MFKREIRSIVVIAIFACLFGTRVVFAEKPEATDESPSKLAQQVYDSLLNAYRGGETGVAQLELLNNWSVRILFADLIAAELGDGLAAAEIAQQSMQSHLTRMRTLEEIVEKKVDAGLVRKSDLLAARYFHRFNISIGQIVKQMQQQLRPVEVEGDFDIKLPAASQAKPLASKPPVIAIDINAKGVFSVKGKELSINELQKLLNNFADDRPESATAVIRAHPECVYGTVVRALDVCNKAGLPVSFQVVGDKSEEN